MEGIAAKERGAFDQAAACYAEIGRHLEAPTASPVEVAAQHHNLAGRDPFCSDVCLLLLTHTSPVTPYKPAPIAGVSYASLTGRGPTTNRAGGQPA